MRDVPLARLSVLPMDGAGDRTLASYQAAADRYVRSSRRPAGERAAFLDRLAALVPGGHVLEIGSGPGWDAEHLESAGVHVTRTDATPAFVRMLRDAGHEAELLDVRRDAVRGGHDAVLANAVLLHLTPPELADALGRLGSAVRPGGYLAFTMKEGDGSGWTEAKLGLPRYFTYWRAPALRAAVARAGWTVLSCEEVDGLSERWLLVLAQRAG